jgi:hypothetical protein
MEPGSGSADSFNMDTPESEKVLRRYILATMVIVIMLMISVSGRNTPAAAVSQPSTVSFGQSAPVDEMGPKTDIEPPCSSPASALECVVVLPSQLR